MNTSNGDTSGGALVVIVVSTKDDIFPHDALSLNL